MNTCRGCKHWHQVGEPAAVATPAGQALMLGQPRPGECRARPPELVILPTPQGVSLRAAYKPLNDDFPACGEYAP